jgi:hypothetical protein
VSSAVIRCQSSHGLPSRPSTLPPDVPAGGDAPHHPGMMASVSRTIASPGWRARWRALDRKLLVASLAIAVGLVLIGYGLARSVTGDEATDLPDEIERIAPVPDAVQVPQQTQVIVDLQAGFTGRMVIDDVELETVALGEGTIDVEPGQQIELGPGVVFEPGNATLTFTPGGGTAIDSFAPGAHLATVIYWDIELGEDDARSYSWTFTVV